jgi:sortase B
MKNKIISILMIVLCFCSYYGVSEDFTSEKTSTTSKEDLREILSNKKFKVATDNSNFPNKKIVKDFFSMKAKNKDTIAYLSIPNMCSYPVMYSGDNSFYLKHNENKEKSKLGAIFLNKDSRDNTTMLLHGHRMKNGKMFGSLAKYEIKKYFKTNEPIEVFDGEYLYYYKPYTVFLLKDGVEYINLQEMNYLEKNEYFKGLQKKSEIKNSDKVDYNARMLFLSTCDYDFKDARLIVGSYLIKKIPYNK